MEENYQYSQAYLEWEILELDDGISNVIFENEIYSLSNSCVIRFNRNDQYDLSAQISGIINNREEIEPKGLTTAGTFVSKENITAQSRFYDYKFYGIVIGAHSLSPLSLDPISFSFNADLITHKIEKKNRFSIETEVAIISEWYLSANTDVHFPRSTKRKIDKVFTRSREGTDTEDKNTIQRGSSSSRDHILGKAENFYFIISKVPKAFGPEWSFNLAIEYRNSLGRMPTFEERKAISEIVSFVFGTQLLKVGHSNYDKSENLISEAFENPWGDNVIAKCGKYGTPPVFIGHCNDWNRAEKILNELIMPYMALRDELSLNNCFWKYWIAKYSSIGANLPILSSAVETLAARVIKKHPEIKHYYIRHEVFSKLLNPELHSIVNKIGVELSQNYPNEQVTAIQEIISNKLKSASQRTANEKMIMFFEIINLPIAQIEKSAMRARNKMAHTLTSIIEDNEIIETVRLTRAYETLFHRIILKILGFSETYIDYYTFGHPNRSLDEPIR